MLDINDKATQLKLIANDRTHAPARIKQSAKNIVSIFFGAGSVGATVHFKQTAKMLQIRIHFTEGHGVKGRISRNSSLKALEHRISCLIDKANVLAGKMIHRAMRSMCLSLRAMIRKQKHGYSGMRSAIEYYRYLPSIDEMVRNLVKSAPKDSGYSRKFQDHLSIVPMLIMICGTPKMRKRLVHDMHANHLVDNQVKFSELNFVQFPCFLAIGYRRMIEFIELETSSILQGYKYQMKYQRMLEGQISNNVPIRLALNCELYHKIPSTLSEIYEMPLSFHKFLSKPQHIDVMYHLLNLLHYINEHHAKIEQAYLMQDGWKKVR